MKFLSKDHFLTMVAKDSVIRHYGAGTKNWPAENFWAVVSSFKSTITDDQVPDLMAAYKVDKLPDFHHGKVGTPQ